MIIIATIPVGITGVAGEHTFRVVFGHVIWAAVFLIANGLILLAAERHYRAHPPAPRPAARADAIVPELVPAGDPPWPPSRSARGREPIVIGAT
jgi:undecaprenyl-diphosphatase